MAVAVSVLPAASVTVRVTVFSPEFSQLNSVTSSANVAMPQLSADPLSTSSGATVTVPSSLILLYVVATATGVSVSVIATVMDAVVTLPAASVPVI